MPEYHHGAQHGHTHTGHTHSAATLSGRKIFWVTLLNAIITVTEIVGGLLSGSLALLSDAIHNLSDTAAIVLSYVANRIAQKPNNSRKTFGYKRAEILTAFINATALLAISAFLIVEAFHRWRDPQIIDGTMMMIVAFIGLFSNLLSVLLLERDSHHNLNIRSSYLHLLGDTISSIGVVVGGMAIRIWGVAWVDPLITLLISLYIIKETWQIIRRTVDILMQSSADLDYPKIKSDIETFEHVRNLHHIHSWMINEDTIYFEAHLELDNMELCDAQVIYEQIEHLLQNKYHISHVTLQAEVDKCNDKEMFRV